MKKNECFSGFLAKQFFVIRHKKNAVVKQSSTTALVTPPGFEPRSQEPESCILSIELWGLPSKGTKILNSFSLAYYNTVYFLVKFIICSINKFLNYPFKD
jgi:hypothetical protein